MFMQWLHFYLVWLLLAVKQLMFKQLMFITATAVRFATIGKLPDFGWESFGHPNTGDSL